MLRRLVVWLLLLGSLPPAVSQPIVIKMGTLAPDGSLWHKVLLEIRDRWQKISAGKVRLVIYPGGMFGDEPDLVNKMRINQIQAVALSGAGMADIDKSVSCLQIPMLFQSYQELDYVRDRIAPQLEKKIEARGYLVLNWGDAGWVHFFSKTKAIRPDDYRKMKLFTWAGDNDELELWKANGFHPVPLAATDILSGLQTGLIEVVPTTPLFALLNQSFGLAPYMSDIKWAPLIGATLIRKSAWDALPAGMRSEMYQAAHDAGEKLREGIRRMGDDAVDVMQHGKQKTKLTLVHADAAVVEAWRKEAEGVYPKLRGKMIPADMFDEVRRLRDRYRAGLNGGSQ